MGEIEETLNERGKNYGEFSSHAYISQQLKDMMGNTPSWSKCSASQREALDMIVHKIARILNGNPNHRDSWIDIAGYAQLEADILKTNETSSKIKEDVARNYTSPQFVPYKEQLRNDTAKFKGIND